MNQALQGIVLDQTPAGVFRIFVTPPDGLRQEITMFRGAPITVSSYAWGDPFSEEVAQLSCPQITAWDALGTGDLAWLVEGSDVDIVWQPAPGSPITDDWRWEGYIASLDMGVDDTSTSFTIPLKGALFALDNYLAIPTFPAHPLPYEYLMRSAFDPEQHPCSLNPLDVEFPDGWITLAPAATQAENQLLRPVGVLTGSPWTGLTSRSTGNWNPVLTGFIQSLLQVMYNADGSQWTIRNRPGRSPQLTVRKRPDENDPKILNVDLGAPGVKINLSKDYSQAVNVVYGQGTDTAGVTYSGLQMSTDGQSVFYTPFASNPAAYPRTSNGVTNPLYSPQRKVRESFATFQQGLSPSAARAVAQSQLQRFNDPGLTGTITLTSDPYLSDASGSAVLRLLIKAGVTIRINGLLGIPGGVLFHVTESVVDPVSMSVTLTVDTQYRDLLTVDEVHQRTRDPLKTLHTLQNSAQSNQIQDLLLPWSYSDGSGSLPYAAKDFYALLPQGAAFPYTDFTKKYPPGNQAYSSFYVSLGPTDYHDSNNNWARFPGIAGAQIAVPILMSQQGSAAQVQIAAYGDNGDLLPVRFHVSLYAQSGVQVDSMPLWSPNQPIIPGIDPIPNSLVPYPAILDDQWATLGINFPEDSTQRHPFFQGAWQSGDEQGHTFAGKQYLPDQSAGMVIGWGTYYVPAGYWPGQASTDGSLDGATGMMVDTTTWNWDTSASLNAQVTTPVTDSPGGALQNVGRLFAMIYCEDQGARNVHFLGRIIAQNQGGQ